MSMGSAAPAGAVDNVVARIERLPTSWWHVKTRIIVGVATFFDAFDAIAIATVLPVLVPMWKLTGPEIGFMISAGYVGQLIGALLFGWIGERYGRMPAMIGSIAVFAVMSLVCAFAWDYNSLLWFRTLQGIGLGGEVPVAATYISELTRAKNRGRFVLLYELVFPIGLVAVSLIALWVVPTSRLAMDVLHRRAAGDPGAGSARAAAGVAALARGARPHRRGRRRAVADRKRDAEGHRPAAAAGAAGGRDDATSARRCPTCSARLYLRRTLVVWVIWFAAYFINYGLVIWLPTIFRTVYKLPLDVSLRYGLITQAAGFVGTFICALTIDHVGRRPYFAVSFAAAAVSLGLLAMQPSPTRRAGADCMSPPRISSSAPSTSAPISTRRSFTRRGRARSASARRRRGCALPR